MQDLKFTIPEILSLLGVTQCTYIIIYMLFGSGSKKSIIVPSAYFFMLGCAFFLDFSIRFIGDATPDYYLLQWAAWYAGPPLSVLLILQIARVSSLPARSSYWVLLLLPAAYFAAVFASQQGGQVCAYDASCHELRQWLSITGLLAGLISMLEIWKNRELIETIYNGKSRAERDRYWLILMLLGVNILFLAFMFYSLNTDMDEFQSTLMRTILGLALIYLAGTSLFRIYPQAVRILSPQERHISTADQHVIEGIRVLIDRDKVYQEATYSRADMARELDTSEATISKLINLHFGKSFPQLLNEKRVEDAKRLLRQTDAAVKTVAEDVGFNSMASFNRVFKEISGMSPSEYREKN